MRVRSEDYGLRVLIRIRSTRRPLHMESQLNPYDPESSGHHQVKS